MVRLTDRPDMTLDVYRGLKITIQQHFQEILFTGPLVMANSRAINQALLKTKIAKLKIQCRLITKYNCFKFHILLRYYLVQLTTLRMRWQFTVNCETYSTEKMISFDSVLFQTRLS